MSKHNLLIVIAGMLTFLGGAGVANAVPVQWSVNGHYYDVVSSKDYVSWDEANRDSQTLEHNGLSGHLVTLTSAAENDFVWQLLSAASADDFDRYWLGGYQVDGASEPVGGWTWVTTEVWDYENWHVGEPNNSGRHGVDQNWLHYWDTTIGEWDDMDLRDIMTGYVIEYDSFSLRPDAAVPAPLTVLMFGAGLIGIAVSRVRRKV